MSFCIVETKRSFFSVFFDSASKFNRAMLLSSSAFCAFKLSNSSFSVKVKAPFCSNSLIFSLVVSNSLFNDESSDSNSELSLFSSSNILALDFNDMPKCSATFLQSYKPSLKL